MTAVPAPRLRAARVEDTRPAAWLIRLTAASLLALFAGAHWATIVRPSAGGELVLLFVIALVAALALGAVLALDGRLRRWPALLAFALVVLVFVLIAAHVPVRTLRPDR